MPDAAPSLFDNRFDDRQRIEDELLEEVCRTKQAWRVAKDPEQVVARQCFMDALDAFNKVVIYGKEPGKR